MALTLAACADQTVLRGLEDGQPQTDAEINFRNYVAGMSRASRSVSNPFNRGDAMAVWGHQTTGSSTDTIFNNKRVEYVSEDVWVYSGIKLWNIGSTYKFYGFFPHSENLYTMGQDNCISIPHYVNPANPDEQQDLMVSEMRAISPFNMVDMIFHHIMSNVNIRVRCASGFDTTGVSGVTLRSLQLHGVRESGSYSQTGWTGVNLPVGDWSSQSGEMVMTPIEDVAIEMGSTGTTVMDDWIMLPQQLALDDGGGVTMSVSFTVTYADGSSSIYIREGVPLAGITGHDMGGNNLSIERWECDCRYTYTLLFNPSQGSSKIEFTATVGGWDDCVEDGG